MRQETNAANLGCMKIANVENEQRQARERVMREHRKLGLKLRIQRIKCGVTCREVAQAMGISPVMITRMEKAINPIPQERMAIYLRALNALRKDK